MIRKIRAMLLAGVLIGGSTVAATAQNADAVRTRITNYKQLGTAFKAYNDALRGGDASAPVLRQSADQIAAAARNQYKLFPANSRASAGVRTKALPEIWTKAPEFKAAQDQFAREAAALVKVNAGGDIAAMRSQSRKLGGTCKSCHDRFREES